MCIRTMMVSGEAYIAEPNMTQRMPQNTQSMQLSSVARYGSDLNSSTSLFLMIRQNVGLHMYKQKASAPSSESNPNYQPPSIESRLDKRTRGMAAAAYTGERKRPKEMTLPMMPTTLRAASGEIILLAASGWGTWDWFGLDGARGEREGEREQKQLRFGSRLRSRDQLIQIDAAGARCLSGLVLDPMIWLVSLREQVTSFEFYYASSSLLSLSLSTWILTRTILESQDTVLL